MHRADREVVVEQHKVPHLHQSVEGPQQDLPDPEDQVDTSTARSKACCHRTRLRLMIDLAHQ